MTQPPRLPHSIHMVSLGCPKNLVDSEVMLGQLSKMGIFVAPSLQTADVIIVNTCGFIDAAKKESIHAILEAAEFKKSGACRALIVAGCIPQRYRSDIALELPEVDAFLGPDDCGRIGAIVQDVWGRVGAKNIKFAAPLQYVPTTGRPHYLYDHESPRQVLTPRHIAYVKIAEGCDNACTFCVIPRLRGSFRSRPMESILQEARALVQGGAVELILIAQDLTSYGIDLGRGPRLTVLLEKMQDIEGLRWIRLLYTHPAHVTEDLIAAVADLPKVCKYLDMPLQHLSDGMLERMGRGIGKRQTLDLIARIRERVPGVALRTTLLVGMPGESEKMFEEMLAEVWRLRFERLGVFTFSREEGTAAYHFKDRVPQSVMRQRRALIMAAQQEVSHGINETRVGKVMDVLIDAPAKKKGFFTGRSQWDAPGIDNTVLVRGENLCPGAMVRVQLTQARAYDCEGIHLVKGACD